MERDEARRRPREEAGKKKTGIKRLFKRGNIKWLIFFAFFVYVCVVLLAQQPQLRAAQQRQAELEAQEAELQAEIDRLKGEKDYIGSGEYIEKEAREQLGWVKEGEIIFKESGE